MMADTSGLQVPQMSTEQLSASNQNSVGVLQQQIDSQMVAEGQSLVNESSFDIELELQKVLGQDPSPVDLPVNVEGVLKILRPLKESIKLMAVRLRRPTPDECDTRLWNDLSAFLYCMHNLEVITPQMKTVEKFGATLELVFNPSHKFPVEYAQIARHIHDELEALNWGAEPVQAEEGVTESEPESTTGNAATSSKKKSSGQVAGNHLPRDDDPIYGTQAIMHHILRINGPKAVSYQINPAFNSRNAKVFGHNGLTVGECWPMQIALLRDGAHGQRMGGISGTMDDGAYSIVVSGTYDDLDKDEGDRIYYSGSNSHENTSSVPVTSQKTKALERSITTRRPVRVFRTSEGTWRHCPSAGIRYDGLYTVTAVNIEENGRHGAYKRFTLDRRAGQPAIQYNAPSNGLIRLFARVRDGYSRAPLRPLPTQ